MKLFHSHLFKMKNETETIRTRSQLATDIESCIAEITRLKKSPTPKDDLIHDVCRKFNLDFDFIRKLGMWVPFLPA